MTSVVPWRGEDAPEEAAVVEEGVKAHVVEEDNPDHVLWGGGGGVGIVPPRGESSHPDRGSDRLGVEGSCECV